MIVIQLLGGLGNQLFQFCFGQRLHIEHSTPVYYDTRLLRNHSHGRHEVNRNYALDIFNARVNLDPIISLRYSVDGLPRPIRGLLKLMRITRPDLVVREREFHFSPEYLKKRTAGYFAGTWQSAQYFSKIEPHIRQQLRFRTPLENSARSLAAEISKPGSVCIHVRRTDYVTHRTSTSQLQFIGLNYYRNAIRFLQTSDRDLRYYVFSDDLEWCRQELWFIPNATFVSAEMAGHKDSGHLQLMSLAHKFIIPNSTFSWWAAWLGTQPNKQVIIPQRWFRDPSIDASGLYPHGWHVIPVE